MLMLISLFLAGIFSCLLQWGLPSSAENPEISGDYLLQNLEILSTATNVAEFLDNTSFLQLGCEAVCWLSAHSQQPPHTLYKYWHFDLCYMGEEGRFAVDLFTPGSWSYAAFQALPGSSFSILLCISAPVPGSTVCHRWGSVQCLCAPTDGLWTVLPQNPLQLFLPSWQQLWGILPVCPPAQIPVLDLPSHCSLTGEPLSRLSLRISKGYPKDI